MKFHTLSLAALSILCSLPITSYAQKTAEELEYEIMHLDCPPGQQAAAVGLICPREARDPLDCWRTRVECVQPAFRNDQVERVTVSVNKGISQAVKTEEEFDYEIQHMKCPFGEKPARTSSFCPTGARDPSDCAPVTVRCVKYSYSSNIWGGRTKPKAPTSNPQKTEAELNREVAYMECPVGQRPMKVFALCQSGAKDAECWGWESEEYTSLNIPVQLRIVVKCVRNYIGNVREDSEPSVAIAAPSQKTGEELDYEVQHMQCPVGHRPAKISSFCPPGAKDPRDCTPGEVKCVKESISNVWGSRTDSKVPPPRHQKTDEELDYEIQHMQCRTGERPVKTSSFCPTGAKDTHDCVPGVVKCVKESISNDWRDRTEPKVSTSSSLSPSQKTDEELDYEIQHMECPADERPAKVSFCPPDAKDTRDCANIVVKCVKQSYSNAWRGLPNPEVATPRPLKTDAELNSEVARMKCPYGQKPAKVFAICPPGGEDVDCWEWSINRYELNFPMDSRMVVKCKDTDFGNTREGAESSVTTSTSSPKTEEELNNEVAHKTCPFGQKPTKVFALCPSGAQDSACLEWTTDRYESDFPIESRILVMCKNIDIVNAKRGAKPSRLTSKSTPKTEEELNSEVAHMTCPLGQKPAKMFALCPSDGQDAECWDWNNDQYDRPLFELQVRIVVKCVQNHIGNTDRDGEPIAPTSTSSPKKIKIEPGKVDTD